MLLDTAGCTGEERKALFPRHRKAAGVSVWASVIGPAKVEPRQLSEATCRLGTAEVFTGAKLCLG